MACQPLLRSLAQLPVFVVIFVAAIQKCIAQVVQDDAIVYTTQPGWIDMRVCAKCPFGVNDGRCAYVSKINDRIGCDTNACLCRASTLGQAVGWVAEDVLSICSNYDDQATATNFLLAYCSDKGYTAVGSSVPAETTGASSLTATATVTKAVVATKTVILSAAASSRHKHNIEIPYILCCCFWSIYLALDWLFQD